MNFSIICPVFNTPAALLEEAVSSVLSHDTEGDCEIVLVDDASKNSETIEILDHLAGSDSRVRLIRLDRNGGPSSARGAGVRAASGEWIGFLDSDDQWMEGALAEFRGVIATVPEAQWIVGHYRTFHSDGRIEVNPLLSDAIDGTLVRPGLTRVRGAALTRYLISSFRIHIGGTIVRRATLVQLTDSGFTDGLFYGDDWLLSVRLSAATDLFFIDRETYILRRDHESVVMGSARRLTSDLAAPLVAALKDPSLKAFRREIGWSLYGMRKGLALNNMLSGRYHASVGFALRAYLMDPRQIGDLGRFVRLLFRSKDERPVAGTRYSRLEQFIAR